MLVVCFLLFDWMAYCSLLYFQVHICKQRNDGISRIEFVIIIIIILGFLVDLEYKHFSCFSCQIFCQKSAKGFSIRNSLGTAIGSEADLSFGRKAYSWIHCLTFYI